MHPIELTTTIGKRPLSCTAIPMGDDILIAIQGGDAGHIGSVAFAVARPSLTGAGTSSTCSVLNRTGHKDDEISVRVAREVSAACNCTVAVAAGVHLDGIQIEEIQAVLDWVNTLAPAITDQYLSAKDAKDNS